MRRTRRRPKVVWLPPDPYNRVGTAQGAITDTNAPSIGKVFIEPSGTVSEGSQYGTTVPLVGDGTNSQGFIIGVQGANPNSLSDLFNSGYRLRRIVGNIFCGRVQRSGFEYQVNNWMLTAAFQVMRVDQSGLPVDTPAANPDTYVNQENPWIWRRSWILTNFGVDPLGPRIPMGSSNNFGGGSVKEGTFVDAKTARIIGPDERLFMNFVVTSMDQTTWEGVDDTIEILWNLRVVASLRSNIGNRRNASR